MRKGSRDTSIICPCAWARRGRVSAVMVAVFAQVSRVRSFHILGWNGDGPLWPRLCDPSREEEKALGRCGRGEGRLARHMAVNIARRLVLE